MSLDLVALQRDAVLLDALAQRARTDDADPIAGLLGALAADVDDGLLAVAGPEAAPIRPLIPEQGGQHRRPGTVHTLPLAAPSTGRRHFARAMAAVVVTAAVLSVSGVAAAVTGDPLTPYKRVIDVVRGGYDEVVPKGLVAPKPVLAPAVTSHDVTAAKATRVAGHSREAVASRASRVTDGRHFWDRHVGDRERWDQHGWNRNAWTGPGGNLHERGGWDGSGRHNSRSGHRSGGHDRSGNGSGHYGGQDSRDSGWRDYGSGDWRR
jgi:hypothetical protein